MLRLFDTARGGVHPVELRDPGKVSMYVCGPTVYGPPHLGHGRQVLVYDVLRRYLEWSGFDVHHVSNVTDVDDNIINRANRENRDWKEIATACESVWWRAMDALGAQRPNEDPHASAFIDRMVTLIGDLIDHGMAYETSDGVYFPAERIEDYGLLARQSIESLRAGARVESTEEKRSPVDFVLWKKVKPGEPSWPSPWGEGRPGWHTECVVMSLDLLGDGFDLHAGGQDLAFPHHENERAQAVAEGHRFARHWMHHGFVEVGGEKMSKSLGNFTNLLDLVDESDPRAYRLLLLRAHYRAPMDVTREAIADAEQSLERLDSFARRFASAAGGPATEDALAKFRELMDDDLGTPAATALLFDLVRRANADDDFAAAAAAFAICDAVGLELRTTSGEVGDDALALAVQRDAARAAKEWTRADALRDELIAMGYEVADTPNGTHLRRLP
jgi:cysteinyl-tRNA synthetase